MEQRKNQQQQKQRQKDKTQPRRPDICQRQPNPDPDNYGPSDGSKTVREVLPESRWNEETLSATAKNPNGLIPNAYAKIKTPKPQPGQMYWQGPKSDEIWKADKTNASLLFIVEAVVRGFLDKPYHGLKTRAEILWAIAEAWEEVNREKIVKTYPQWFVAIREMRRLHKNA
jgi:hypothetical protein